MKASALCMVVVAALLAGCERQPEANDRTSTASPASSGGSSGRIDPGPKGERIDIPSAPPSGSAEPKPDPGDANDHSNPQHDSKSGKTGD